MLVVSRKSARNVTVLLSGKSKKSAPFIGGPFGRVLLMLLVNGKNAPYVGQ